MNEWQIALINLIIKVGLDKAIDILSGVKKSATIDDAIVALEKTLQKDLAAYMREA